MLALTKEVENATNAQEMGLPHPTALENKRCFSQTIRYKFKYFSGDGDFIEIGDRVGDRGCIGIFSKADRYAYRNKDTVMKKATYTAKAFIAEQSLTGRIRIVRDSTGAYDGYTAMWDTLQMPHHVTADIAEPWQLDEYKRNLICVPVVRLVDREEKKDGHKEGSGTPGDSDALPATVGITEETSDEPPRKMAKVE